MTKIINKNNMMFYESGNKIICPYSRKQCTALCPLHAINEDKVHHVFYCGGTPVVYLAEETES